MTKKKEEMKKLKKSQKQLKIDNNEIFKVVEIISSQKFVISNASKGNIEISVSKIIGLFELRELLLSQEQFKSIFYPAYCITIHAAQGCSYNFPYTIHEWDRLNKKLKYTALTRSTCLEYVNII